MRETQTHKRPREGLLIFFQNEYNDTDKTQCCIQLNWSAPSRPVILNCWPKRGHKGLRAFALARNVKTKKKKSRACHPFTLLSSRWQYVAGDTQHFPPYKKIRKVCLHANLAWHFNTDYMKYGFPYTEDKGRQKSSQPKDITKVSYFSMLEVRTCTPRILPGGTS